MSFQWYKHPYSAQWPNSLQPVFLLAGLIAMCLPQFCTLDFLDLKMDSSPLCLSRFREQIPGSQCRRVEIPFSGLKLRCENSAWRQGSGAQYISRIFWKSLLTSISFLGDNLSIVCVCVARLRRVARVEKAGPLRVAKLVERQLFCNSCVGSLTSFWNVVFTA